MDRRLSDTLAAALVQFARTGTPNSRGLPNWPAYDERRERVLVIRERAEARVLLRRAALDFYDSVFGSAHPAGRGFPAVPQR